MITFNTFQLFTVIYRNKPELKRRVQLVKEEKDYYLVVENGQIKKFLKRRIIIMRGLPTDLYPAEPFYNGFPISVSIKQLENKIKKLENTK